MPLSRLHPLQSPPQALPLSQPELPSQLLRIGQDGVVGDAEERGDREREFRLSGEAHTISLMEVEVIRGE